VYPKITAASRGVYLMLPISGDLLMVDGGDFLRRKKSAMVPDLLIILSELLCNQKSPRQAAVST